MYPYCEIIERVFDSRGGGSVVRYWHVFPASYYWDQNQRKMVYGQTRAYRYSDTPDRPWNETPMYKTRAARQARELEQYQETLRTGLNRSVRGET